MKKIEDLPEPVSGEDPLDRIVMLLNNGISRDDVYRDIVERCSLFYTNKSRKQSLANHIAKVDTMSVFATMKIPEQEKNDV